jgi:hypothetical protein
MTKQNNTEFLVDVMEFSKSGPLMQIFVIEALRYYSELVSKTEATETEKDSVSLINPKAWRETAKELHKLLTEKYEPKTTGDLPQKLS